MDHAQVTTPSLIVVGSNADNAQGFLKALKVRETVQVRQAGIQTQTAVARRLRALPIAKAVGDPVANNCWLRLAQHLIAFEYDWKMDKQNM